MATLKDLKPEEIEWSGIKSFLEGKEKVNKQELIDYLEANQVQVEDVVLGEKPTEADINVALSVIGYSVEKSMEGGFDIIDPDGDFVEYDEAPENVKAIIKNISSQPQTNYDKYTLPNGENYREVLFTLPESNMPAQGWRVEEHPSGKWAVWTKDGYRLNQLFDSREQADRQVPKDKTESYSSARRF
jgi:hypothetical protein